MAWEPLSVAGPEVIDPLTGSLFVNRQPADGIFAHLVHIVYTGEAAHLEAQLGFDRRTTKSGTTLAACMLETDDPF